MIVAVCIVVFGLWLLYKLPTETGLLGIFWLILIVSVATVVLFLFGGLNAILNRKK